MSWVYLQLPPKTESLWSPGWLFWRQLDLLTPCPPHWSVSSSLNNEAQLFHLRLLLMSVAVSFIMLSATLPKACLPPELFVARLEVPSIDKMIFLLFVRPVFVLLNALRMHSNLAYSRYSWKSQILFSCFQNLVLPLTGHLILAVFIIITSEFSLCVLNRIMRIPSRARSPVPGPRAVHPRLVGVISCPFGPSVQFGKWLENSCFLCRFLKIKIWGYTYLCCIHYYQLSVLFLSFLEVFFLWPWSSGFYKYISWHSCLVIKPPWTLLTYRHHFWDIVFHSN